MTMKTRKRPAGDHAAGDAPSGNGQGRPTDSPDTAHEQAPGAGGVQGRLALLWQQLGMTLVLIALCVILSIVAPHFLTERNAVNIFRQVSINAILAVGLTFVILTGGIDLSVGSALAVTGVLAVWFEVHHAPSPLAVIGGLLIGALIGLVNGLFVARLKLQPFIVTLGALTYLRGLAYVATGAYPLVKPNLGFAWLGSGFIGPVPVPVLIAAVVFAVSWFVLKRTVFGRHVYAIGGNEQAARLSGIAVPRTLTWVYTISGVCAGLAGVLYSARLESGQPQGGVGYELDAIAAVILGGTSLSGGVGSVMGTLVGALIIGVLDNGLVLMNVPFFYQLVIRGGVIIAAVLLDRVRTARIV